ncbi:MAG: TRAM domain-containing protein, partial [archaeon]|nr:TRAM domain-containing protein [archaeon]
MGKEYDVTITEISRRGDGIASDEGYVIFVPHYLARQRKWNTIVQ